MSKLSSAMFAAALAGSAPLMAQTQAPAQPQQPAAPAVAPPNSNEIICERQEVTGSRLAKKKVCKTRAEWADQTLQDRQAIEKTQVQARMPGE